MEGFKEETLKFKVFKLKEETFLIFSSRMTELNSQSIFKLKKLAHYKVPNHKKQNKDKRL